MRRESRPVIRFEMVVLDTDDPPRLASFYAELLGWRVIDADPEWVTIGDDTGLTMGFQLTITYRPPTWPSAEVPQQYHLDLLVEDLDAACAYAMSIGAVPVRASGGRRYRVFTDPSGHRFCLTLAGESASTPPH